MCKTYALRDEYLAVLSSRERGLVMDKGIEAEEAILLPLAELAKRKGPDSDYYLVLVEVFSMYCTYGDTEKALQILERMDPIPVEYGDDCSLLIARKLVALSAPTEVVFRYIERMRGLLQAQPETSEGRWFHEFEMSCIELRLWAQESSDSSRIPELVAELCELKDSYRRYNEDLFVALRLLLLSGKVGAETRPLLEMLRSSIWRHRRRYGPRCYVSELKDINGLLQLTKKKNRVV